MGFLNRAVGRKGRPYRCFFATDIHGSERCFRKFLAAARVYEADVLILGGDIAGKAIVPIRRVKDGQVALTHEGRDVVLSDAEAEPMIASLRDSGLYPRLCTDDDCERLAEEPDYREHMF